MTAADIIFWFFMITFIIPSILFIVWLPIAFLLMSRIERQIQEIKKP